MPFFLVAAEDFLVGEDLLVAVEDFVEGGLPLDLALEVFLLAAIIVKGGLW